MIVCSCNVLSDQDVRAAVTRGRDAPRTTGQVYGCLGCSAQCGRCARTIRRIMDEALAAAVPGGLHLLRSTTSPDPTLYVLAGRRARNPARLSTVLPALADLCRSPWILV